MRTMTGFGLTLLLACFSACESGRNAEAGPERAGNATLTASAPAPSEPLFVDVTDEDGKVTNWTIETAPTPYTLALRGWNKRRSEEALAPGTVVTVTMAPSRAGTPVALLRGIVNEEGVEIFGGDIDAVSFGRDQNPENE